MKSTFFAYPRADAAAGVVVFLIALPLCLGIAVACGVPPISGLVAGIVGGLVVPLISRSPLSITGPAAGLTTVVLAEVSRLGGIGPFLAALIIAGILQAGLGVVRAGRFSALVPASVIRGMLAAIGITIVWKQLPVAFGVKGGVADIPAGFGLGATLIAAVSLVILYTWKRTPMGKGLVPAPLIVVVVGSALGALFERLPALALAPSQLVTVPLGGAAGLLQAMPRPDFSQVLGAETWIAAVTIAVVASIETLLSVQAVDRLDPLKRKSPADRELVAQGVGNAVSGLLGGLPITAVIVRSSANLSAGGRERLSAVVHALLIVVSVLAAAPLLNRIPLACLAAVLIQVGLNLAKPALFRTQARLGFTQWLPFAVTIAAVLALDLLKGVLLGLACAVALAWRQRAAPLALSNEPDGTVRIRFPAGATFLSKGALQRALDGIADGSMVVVESGGAALDHDVLEQLMELEADAPRRRLALQFVGITFDRANAGGAH